jgi:hypothetical protein
MKYDLFSKFKNLLSYIITAIQSIQSNVQHFQHHLPHFPFLCAQPQRAAAHPPQRLQARGCSRARRCVLSSLLLHLGVCKRHARLALKIIFKHEE